jgi:hypothetical protein
VSRRTLEPNSAGCCLTRCVTILHRHRPAGRFLRSSCESFARWRLVGWVGIDPGRLATSSSRYAARWRAFTVWAAEGCSGCARRCSGARGRAGANGNASAPLCSPISGIAPRGRCLRAQFRSGAVDRFLRGILPGCFARCLGVPSLAGLGMVFPADKLHNSTSGRPRKSAAMSTGIAQQ